MSRPVKILFGAVGLLAIAGGFVLSPALGIILTVFILVAALSVRIPSVSLLLCVLPLTIGESILGSLSLGVDASILQKALILCGLLVAAGVLGVKRPHAFVLALLVFFIVAAGLSLVLSDDGVSGPSRTASALMNYSLPWLFFFIAWERTDQKRLVTWIAYLPAIAVGIGVLLHALSIRDLFRVEYGAVRLQAGLPPAYLGALAMFGVFAAVWLWYRGDRWALLPAGLSILIVLATGTRGPILVAGGVAGVMLLFGPMPWLSRRKALYGRLIVSAAMLAALALFLPRLLVRSLNQTVGEGGLSGRDIAWDYFWLRFEQSPIFGHGIGAYYPLSQQSKNEMVRNYFLAPHNTYLQFLVDFGVVGAIILSAILVAILVVALRTSNRTDRLALATLIPLLMFYSYFDNLFAAIQPAVLFVAVLAVIYFREPSPDGVTRGWLPARVLWASPVARAASVPAADRSGNAPHAGT